MKTLTSQIKAISELSADLKNDMFRLYARYYDGTNEAIFNGDLKRKNWVVLLYDNNQQLQGFSTLALFSHDNDVHHTVNVLYSGDTIIDKQYWGQHELAVSWLHFAGQIKAREPDLPLYWLLIVKGYRTYRYLSAFSRQYYPTPNESTPGTMQTLMDALGTRCFDKAYDKTKGIISFPDARGYLKDAWAEIPEKVKKRADVQFFLTHNPHFYKGDELLCICELSEANLKPFSRRIFLAGFNLKQEQSA